MSSISSIKINASCFSSAQAPFSHRWLWQFMLRFWYSNLHRGRDTDEPIGWVTWWCCGSFLETKLVPLTINSGSGFMTFNQTTSTNLPQLWILNTPYSWLNHVFSLWSRILMDKVDKKPHICILACRTSEVCGLLDEMSFFFFFKYDVLRRFMQNIFSNPTLFLARNETNITEFIDYIVSCLRSLSYCTKPI